MTDVSAGSGLPCQTDEEPGRELVPFVSLDDRAASINRHIDLIAKADATASRHRIRAGQELLEVRAILAHGEWLPWCKANIKRGPRDVQKLLKIAGAADPAAAHAEENAQRRATARTIKYATVAHLESPPPPCSPVVEPSVVEVVGGIEARAAKADFKVGATLVEQVNALSRAVVEPFIYDLGPLFIAFVKEHPDLEDDAIASLHSALDGVETMCRNMRETLIEIGEARYAVKQAVVAAQQVESEPAGEIESVKVVASVEPVAEEEGGFATGVLEAIEADAQAPVAPVTKAKPAKARAAPTVIKAAPKNKRSMIGAVTRPDPETYAKIAAEALARAA